MTDNKAEQLTGPLEVLIKKSEIMKTQDNTKSGPNAVSINPERHVWVRHSSKLIENRHERRKIRERLRQLGWVHSVTDEIFA